MAWYPPPSRHNLPLGLWLGLALATNITTYLGGSGASQVKHFSRYYTFLATPCISIGLTADTGIRVALTRARGPS